MERSSGARHRRPRALDSGLRDADLDKPFAEQRDRARSHRPGREVVPVGAAPGHTAEEGTGNDVVGVVHDSADVDAREVSPDVEHVDVGEELVEVHNK